MMDKFTTFTFGVHRQYIYLHRDNHSDKYKFSKLLHLVYIDSLSIFIEATKKPFTMTDKFSTFTFGVHRQYSR